MYDFDREQLAKYNVTPDNYFMLIARMEPENNIELILESYAEAHHPSPFLVIGGHQNKFGRLMVQKFSRCVRFLGGVYDKKELDALRHFSKAYFHGHSVGGTNPSLLEAMSCRSFILAHDNPFNKGVLGADAIYFGNQKELTTHFNSMEDLISQKSRTFKNDNFEKIIQYYDWERITRQHEDLFGSLLTKV